ncbi:TNR6 factor, partial [Turnix velox]|nr:TNR6 factor [Turnix velox]
GFVKNITCPTDIGKHCVPCQNGKEYMDHINDLDKCFRCSSCDIIFGLEVAKNCTPGQNTECTCAKNHFCNSTLPCRHCYQCTICGTAEIHKLLGFITVKDVTCSGTFPNTFLSKSGTLGTTGDREVQCKLQRELKHQFSFLLLDIDLSSHIAGIVEEMNLKDVLMFVRHHKVTEPVIDETIRDYANETSEQKIKLFRVWYQRHGIKGAYGTLISSLRELKMCTVADKIEEKIKAAVPSCQEGGQSYNDDMEQSKTCTQERKNSYNGSTGQNKMFCGSLEET